MALVTTNNVYYTEIAAAIRAKNGESGLYTPAQMAGKIADISTGAELGFEIAGGTAQPESPTEGLIWVNTESEITGWFFGASAPTDITEGTLWFSTWNTSPIKLNILAQNGAEVCPVCVSQYISGVWMPKVSWIYTSGAWTEMGAYLVRNGTAIASFTALKNGSGAEVDTDKLSVTFHSVQTDSWAGDAMDIASMGSFMGGGVVTSGLYDTASATALKVAYKCIVSGCTSSCRLYLGVTTEESPYIEHYSSTSAWLAKTYLGKTETAGTASLDLSGVSGMSRVVIGIGTDNDSTLRHTYITDIWLE